MHADRIDDILHVFKIKIDADIQNTFLTCVCSPNLKTSSEEAEGFCQPSPTPSFSLLAVYVACSRASNKKLGVGLGTRELETAAADRQ